MKYRYRTLVVGSVLGVFAGSLVAASPAQAVNCASTPGSKHVASPSSYQAWDLNVSCEFVASRLDMYYGSVVTIYYSPASAILSFVANGNGVDVGHFYREKLGVWGSWTSY
jgi:hypothetical protein